ncbi:MAG: hypothetical protein ABSD20_14590 [Terriglobales bacterium]|jgi:hypothetical protein
MASSGSNSARTQTNRRNARKSTGPANLQLVRHNATTHGMYARGLTDLDDREEYERSLANLKARYKPKGELESFHVQCIAMNMMRMKRAWRLEEEYINEQLHPAKAARSRELVLAQHCQIIDPGQPAPLQKHMIEPLVSTFQRYQTAIANEIGRSYNQLERLQRLGKGELVPAPATGDITVHSQGR